MAAGNTYTQIASTTLGSAAASVTFSSIPGTYTDLVLVINSLVASGSPNTYLQFNGDTTTNYSSTILGGNGTSAASTRYSNRDHADMDYFGYNDTTTMKMLVANIFNYANTTTFKTLLSRPANAATGTDAIVCLWRKTPEAISSIRIYTSNGPNFVVGSTFNLYGISAA